MKAKKAKPPDLTTQIFQEAFTQQLPGALTLLTAYVPSDGGKWVVEFCYGGGGYIRKVGGGTSAKSALKMVLEELQSTPGDKND